MMRTTIASGLSATYSGNSIEPAEFGEGRKLRSQTATN